MKKLQPKPRKKLLCLLPFWLATGLLLSCAAKTAPAREPGLIGPPVTQPSTGVAKPEWEQEWDKLVAAARQEGRVVLYTTAGPGPIGAIRQGFRQAYGIEVESVTGRGAELREKIFRERQAGLYLADIFMMASSFMILVKPEGILDPLKPQLALPEVLDPNLWYSGGHIYHDKERAYVMGFCFFPEAPIVINSDLVKPEEIKNYGDLLQPRWKGKLVMDDPTITGPGEKWFQMVHRSLGPGFLTELAKQEPIILRDHRLKAEWVARGKYSVLLAPQRAAVAEFMNVGAPLRYLSPADGAYSGSGTGSISLVKKAAYPNAARVFINWLLTREGQTIYSKAFLIQSARLDVPTDHLDPLVVRQPGVVYANSDDEDLVLEREKVAREATRILGLRP